jgi:hypothetical protein
MMRLAAHLGHSVRRLASDAALGGVRSFPRRVADLTADALSTSIGRRVSSVEVIDGAKGTSST